MRQFPQVLRHSVRIARRDPGFVTTAALTLAVGIGAATAAMSVAASVLRNPLPIKDDSRLVLITKALPTSSTLVPFSYAEIAAWRAEGRTFEDIAGVQYDGAWPWPADWRGHPMTVTGTAVSGNFFDVLGVRSVIGRLLQTEDASAGREVVAVIGYSLWRREFNGSPALIGQRVRLDGRPATIVGVAPEGFALVVRGTAREREIALRAALGATRWRLIGELLTESTCIAVAAGGVGALIAFWMLRALVAAAPAGLPRLEQIVFDRRALAFAAAGSLLSAALAGIAPALGTVRRARTDLRWLVLSRIARPIVVGLLLGTVAAIVVGPLLRPLLFHVSPIDARALAGAWLTLGFASLIASVVPLYRAGRVDPVALLRLE